MIRHNAAEPNLRQMQKRGRDRRQTWQRCKYFAMCEDTKCDNDDGDL